MKIGIHRPYQPKAVKTTAKNEKTKYDKLQADIETYLKEMNIDVKLYKDMMIVSPRNNKMLTWDEIVGYGLGQDDTYIQEADAMDKALKLNISRRELAVREQRAAQVCELPKNDDEYQFIKYFECKDKIFKSCE